MVVLKKLSAAAALVLASTFGAQALTVSAGDSICEGGDVAVGSVCDKVVSELGQSPTQDFDLDFSTTGEAFLNGFVRGQNNLQYADTATFSGAGTYRFTIEILSLKDGSNFDARMRFLRGMTVLDSDLLVGAGDSFSTLVDLSMGDVVFDLDASRSASNIADGTGAYYKVSIAAVPLPAGGLLLLTGLGALALRRRRKS